MYLFRPGSKSTDRPKPIEQRILVDNVSTLRFRYFGRMSETDGPAWHTEWMGALRLPDLIAVNVTFAPNVARTWPELVVVSRLK